jgi:putative methionine-R-sulfoxide reductase with GAF domain
MEETSRFSLQTWLWENSAGERLTFPAVELDDPLLTPVASPREIVLPHSSDYTALLSALAAVKREVEVLGSDKEAALQLIARRTQAFTRASGVAIALSEGSQLTCRATAGNDTPPVGAHLQVGSGFSGECVRSGKLLHCNDTENDSLVDRESCRALGIRSMVAVPLRAGDQVVGLLEVFSPEVNHFGADDEIVLRRLALIISEAGQRPAETEPEEEVVDDEFPIEAPPELPLPQFSHSRNGLLVSAAVTVAVAILWLVVTWNSDHPTASTQALSTAPSQSRTSIVPPPALVSMSELENLRTLAEKGDSTAQFALATRYATGQDVPQNYDEAIRWFTRAAEQGYVMAQSALASYYWAGRGVSPDPAKAYFWSLIAKAGGDDASASRISILKPRLSHSDIATQQQQATQWLKDHPPSAKDANIVR